ncbi:MAG: redoxin domain-containing protein [Aggregatilineales bacterium]
MELSIGLVFIAGLVSFISPCVLPLVPAYIGYMGGRITHSIAVTSAAGSPAAAARTAFNRTATLMHGLFFVGGFTFVFVTIGLLTTAFISVIGGQHINTVTAIIGRLGGLVIVFFGLQFMGIMPALFARLLASDKLLNSPFTGATAAVLGSAAILWGFTGTVAVWEPDVWEFAPWAPTAALALTAGFALWLVLGGAFSSPRVFWTRVINSVQRAIYMDTRREMARPGQQGLAGSALMGVIFSAGWTPCIGPVYGAVLTMAQSGGSVAQAGLLMVVYSLGLGIPFLLTALMLDSARGILRRLRNNMRRIEITSGAFLVLIGVLVASGSLQQLSLQFSVGQFADFSFSVEESVIELFGSRDSEERTQPDTETNPENDGAGALPNIAALASANVPATGLDVGQLAPVFETVTESGQPLRLADLRGKVVLLNFWATWCSPCRLEMPTFESAFRTHSEKGLAVVAVNNAEPAAAVQGFRQELGLSFPLALDPSGAIQNLYGVRMYPSTFVLDRSGTIVARHFGVLTESQIANLLDSLLGS